MGSTWHGIDASNVAGLRMQVGLPTAGVRVPRVGRGEDWVESREDGEVPLRTLGGRRQRESGWSPTGRHAALVVHVPSQDL